MNVNPEFGGIVMLKFERKGNGMLKVQGHVRT